MFKKLRQWRDMQTFILRERKRYEDKIASLEFLIDIKQATIDGLLAGIEKEAKRNGKGLAEYCGFTTVTGEK